jgi:hypothetical protein
MKKLVRPKKTRRLRPVRLAAWAVAVAAAVTPAAGTAAADGDAAPARKADTGSYLRKKFRHPKLSRGLLTIEGTEVQDKITLRLQTGQPAVLQVDVGDDGSSDFSFKRRKIARIAIDVETETTPSPAARASRRCSVATGTTRSTATGATTWR